MATVYTVTGGEALDLICHRHYGRTAGAVERVLSANPALAATAHNLLIGTRLTLPDLDLSEVDGAVKLWE